MVGSLGPGSMLAESTRWALRAACESPVQNALDGPDLAGGHEKTLRAQCGSIGKLRRAWKTAEAAGSVAMKESFFNLPFPPVGISTADPADRFLRRSAVCGEYTPAGVRRLAVPSLTPSGGVVVGSPP